ncbi:MAG: hypothetical protein Athens071416_524 [Parcubacteria group bacterium Athens0714_16]|nr:MAG: hypothetical protein Athens071416_524 [Parcubacteria group bacterium Athens0714_16]
MDFYNKENRKWILIFGLVVVLIIFIAVFSGVFKSNSKNDLQKDFSFIKLITAEHNFKSGLHDYTGAIMFPTPCYTMSVDAIVRESFPENVTIRFTIDEAKKIEACAQTVTEKNFRIIFQASKEAVVGATINDKPIKLEISKETIVE